jgi:guanylate kinase
MLEAKRRKKLSREIKKELSDSNATFFNTCLLGGPSGAGKNFLQEFLKKDGQFNICKQVTTRPMRSTECQGREYHFISEEVYKEIEHSLTAKTEVNGFHYGTYVKSFENNRINSIIVDIQGFLNFEEDSSLRRDLLFSSKIGIDASDFSSKSRTEGREGRDEDRFRLILKECDEVLINDPGNWVSTDEMIMTAINNLHVNPYFFTKEKFLYNPNFDNISLSELEKFSEYIKCTEASDDFSLPNYGFDYRSVRSANTSFQIIDNFLRLYFNSDLAGRRVLDANGEINIKKLNEFFVAFNSQWPMTVVMPENVKNVFTKSAKDFILYFSNDDSVRFDKERKVRSENIFSYSTPFFPVPFALDILDHQDMKWKSRIFFVLLSRI